MISTVSLMRLQGRLRSHPGLKADKQNGLAREGGSPPFANRPSLATREREVNFDEVIKFGEDIGRHNVTQPFLNIPCFFTANWSGTTMRRRRPSSPRLRAAWGASRSGWPPGTRPTTSSATRSATAGRKPTVKSKSCNVMFSIHYLCQLSDKFDNQVIENRDEPVAVAEKFTSAALHDLAEADEEVS